MKALVSVPSLRLCARASQLEAFFWSWHTCARFASMSYEEMNGQGLFTACARYRLITLSVPLFRTLLVSTENFH